MPAPEVSRSPDPATAAAEWLARLDAGADPAVRAEFEYWLAADPAHAAAWAELEMAWGIFDRPLLRREADRMANELIARRRRRRLKLAVRATTAGMLAAAAMWLVALRLPSARDAFYSANPGSGGLVVSAPERRVLDDGSVVELNRGARIELAFSASQRRVQLLSGEAHFAVTKDARPFVVATPRAEARAVGTEFVVRIDAERIDLLVTEGQVAFEDSAFTPERRSVLVPAGNRAAVPASAEPGLDLQVQPVSDAEIERRLAWRAPRLELSQAPLSDVVAELNRQNRTRITVDDPALARWRLSGVFRADRADEFLRVLEENYGIEISSGPGGQAVLKGRR